MPTRHLAPRRKIWLTSICVGIAVALLAGSIQFMVIYHNRAERFDAIIHNVHTYLQDYFHDLNQTIQGMQPLVDQPCENVASGLTAHAAFSPNVRAILLVKNGLAFCSSATGAMNTPLIQLIPQLNLTQAVDMAILPGTPMMPKSAALALWVRSPHGGKDGIFVSINANLTPYILYSARQNDFSGLALGVPVWEQVKNTMLITLWVFIGVEGAVVVSARARNKQDVGRATLLAVLSALAVYLLVTLLSLGVVPRSELAEIRNPSMAGLMVNMMGSWGEIVIAAGLIISVCGAYLSWTIMAAEVPYLAATHKAFPRLFARTNKNNAPSASLWLTNVSVQASLVLIWLTGSDYNTLLTIASEMILVPYFLVGAFLLKIAERPLHKAVGVGACIYGLWLLYASGPVHLLLSVILYAPGLLVFLYARRTHQHDRMLKRRELALIGFLLVAAVPATWMLVG